MEAINIFLKKEQENNMFDRKIFDINYWEYIRPIVSCECNSIISESSAMFSKSKFNIKKYMINFSDIKKYFIKKDNCDILFVSQARRVKTDNGYKNNYIDYYIDYLKKDYKIICLEEPSWSSLGNSEKSHSFPIYTENIFLTDIHELILLIRIFSYKYLHRKKYLKIIKEYDEVTNIVNGWYKGSHQNIQFKKYFLKSLIRIDIDKKYIKKILRKTNPKIVMLHYMPSIFKQMLINECNNQNIKTIEIQHGTITKVDPLVNKCLDISKLKNDTKYIFSFGEKQVNKYALSIKEKSNVINIGFPFFEEKKKQIGKVKKDNNNYILIISQSTIGDAMAKFASELSEIINDTKYKIVFKYHPNELTKDYECLKRENIIEIKEEKTIYEIQNESILQIGSYSTSLYEGFAMHIPTLIIETMFGSIETIDIFKDIKNGVYYIKKPRDVLNYIGRNDIIPLDKDIDKLWQTNSKQRLKEAIKKIIKEMK